ncbi:unnamed protein product [Blepharisma stoltei]|uniref:UBC core domain-containing protein n=1 Tax=Blepharisma stoltei TaxID=1481888 RepID=A0AAU9IFG9_9CILI|nr:unnamed protein product [Blepharisma stoltei]
MHDFISDISRFCWMILPYFYFFPQKSMVNKMAENSIDLLISIPENTTLCIVAPKTYHELIKLISGQTNADSWQFSIMYDRDGRIVKIIDEKTYSTIINRATLSGKSELSFSVSFERNTMASYSRSDSSDSFSVLSSPGSEISLSLSEIQTPTIKYTIQCRIFNSSRPSDFISFKIEHKAKLLELSKMVLNYHQAKNPGLICAFYSENGYPLVGSLYQMHFTSCDEVLKDKEKICGFIIPDFDHKIEPPINHNDGDDTIFLKHDTDESKTWAIKVNLKKNTFLNLKQKMYNLLSIPTFNLKITDKNDSLFEDNKILSSYYIKPGDILNYFIYEVGNTEGSYKAMQAQSIPQTVAGRRTLHSFLYAFSKVELQKINYQQLLSCIRHLSNNCSPLIQSLYELQKNRSMSVLNSIALEEGFILLIKSLSQNLFNINISDAKLFEHSLEILGVLFEISGAVEDQVAGEEKYEIMNAICPLSLNDIGEPVKLKKQDGNCSFYDYNSVIQYINLDQEIPNVGKILNIGDLAIDDSFKYITKRASLSSKTSADQWIGTFNPKNNSVLLQLQAFTSELTYKQWTQLRNNHPLLKFIAPLSLKSSEFKNHLTLNKSKDICVNLGLTECKPNKITLMNVIDKSCEDVDVSELASQLEINIVEEEQKELITRTPEEAIAVLFDNSSSMDNQYFGSKDKFKRVDAIKQFFESFSDRTIGYDLKNIVSLYVFNSDVQKISNFTENIITFVNQTKILNPKGTTKLWDSFHIAVNALLPLKQKYPEILLRILCLSDGEDTCSQNKPLETAKLLISNKIIADAVVVGELSNELKALCLATGGYIFLPSSHQEGIKLFESETFLSVKCRENVSSKLELNSQRFEELKVQNFSSKAPIMKKPYQIDLSLESSQRTIDRVSVSCPVWQNTSTASRYKRIMKELHILNENPHKYIFVFPCEQDDTFWNIFIKGPKLTPYQNGTFHLYLRFGKNYPFKCPEIRFITPIYHCNVNENGRICHSILDQFYTVDTHIKQLLSCIYGLLMIPEPLDPLDANKAAVYRDNILNYNERAKEYTRLYASKSIKEMIKNLLPNNLISQGAPIEFLDPITKKIMENPVKVHITGITYEKEEIIKVIKTTGRDPKHFKPISVNDLIPNLELKSRIEEYKRKINQPWFLN